MAKTKVEQYIERYMKDEYGSPNHENIFVGNFLFHHTYGKVLDFGCGPSMLFWAMFMQKVSYIDGFDILPENIAYLKEILAGNRKATAYNQIANYIQAHLLKQKATGLIEQCIGKIGRLEVADMLKPLHFPKNSYDCVTEIGCIGCVNTNDELIVAVKNMYACLKIGGRAIFINWIDRKNTKKEEVSCFDGTVDISKEIFKKIFEQACFKKTKLFCKKTDASSEYKAIIYGTAIK